MGTTIELTAADGHRLAAYRAEPAGKPRGALVVIQEIFGVNSHIRGVADGYAADGYLAIAPALFDRTERGVDIGYSQPEIERGRAIMQKVPLDDALKDVAAVDHRRRRRRQGRHRRLLLGRDRCVGRRREARRTRLRGVLLRRRRRGERQPSQPKCPVMFHFGETDHAIPMDAVQQVRAAQPGQTFHIYPAGHGFNCDQRGSYHAESAKLARTRTLEFLRRYVG